MKGTDGNMWIISETKTGTKRWINGSVSSIEYDPDIEATEEPYLVCDLLCEFMTFQTFTVEE